MARQPRALVQVSRPSGRIGAPIQLIRSTNLMTHSSSYDADAIVGSQATLVPQQVQMP